MPETVRTEVANFGDILSRRQNRILNALLLFLLC